MLGKNRREKYYIFYYICFIYLKSVLITCPNTPTLCISVQIVVKFCCMVLYRFKGIYLAKRRDDSIVNFAK